MSKIEEERITKLFPTIAEILRGSSYSLEHKKININVVRNNEIITFIYSRKTSIRFETKKSSEEYSNIKKLDSTDLILKEPEAHNDKKKNLYIFYVSNNNIESVLRKILFIDKHNLKESDTKKVFEKQEELKKDQELINEIEKSNLKGKEKDALVKVRVNQGYFRDKLLKKYNKCCLCNVKEKKLLIASHIKPWAVSGENEKLDVNNGFLLCPNHDALFDKGFITFDADGKIMISKMLSEQDKTFLNVNANMKIELNDNIRKYLEYHRDMHKEKFNQ